MRPDLARVPFRAYHLVLLLLGIQLALGMTALPDTAVTIDEFLDVPVGYITWKAGPNALDLQNPPLIRTLTAAPLSLIQPTIRPLEPGISPNAWATAYQFMADNYDRYLSLFALPRLGVMLLSSLLGGLVYLETRRRYGVRAGLAALTLYVFCPNLLAHGRLATLDLGLTLAVFGTVATFAWMRRRSGLRGPLLLGLVLGLAQVAKFTSLILYPLLFLLALPSLEGDRPRARRFLGLMVACIVSLGVVNAVYGFVGTGTGLRHYGLGSVAGGGLNGGPGGGLSSSIFRALVTWLPGWMPVPLPSMYVLGIDRQLTDNAGYVYYLWGELSQRGWPYYFLIATLVKLTLPALGLSLAGLGAAARRRDLEALLHLAVPVVAVFALFSLLGHKNIGFRYVLPALPFLYVLAGGLFAETGGMPGSGVWPVAGLTLLLAHALEGLACHPHPLSYFNELASVSGGGLHWLGDSNLDWGQDLPALARYLEKHGGPEGPAEVQLAYFGRVDPALYGIRYRLLRGHGEPGLAAVSASFLQGLPYVVLEDHAMQRTEAGWHLRDGVLQRTPPGYYRWLLERPPEAVLGGSIYVFRLP